MQPEESTEKFWKAREFVLRKEAQRWKDLYLAACGYISTRPEWSNKHPQEVADFFEREFDAKQD